MKIVIDISEEKFTCLKNAFESGDWDKRRFAEIEGGGLLFREGTILLKDYGKLIDADWLKRYIWSCLNWYVSEEVDGMCFTWEDIKSAIDAAPDCTEEHKEDD